MKQVLIAFDQLVNTLVPPMADAWADETFSARCWRNRNRGRFWGGARRTVDVLFFFDRAHCERSYLSESERKQLPDEYGNND